MTNKEELLQIITRLEEEKAEVAQDITDILADSNIKTHKSTIRMK
jgi:uncharacterized protein (UPF0335 family)